MIPSLSKTMLAALIMGMGIPQAATAADEELVRRIESLSRELQQLKDQVQANDRKATKAVEEVKGQTAAAGVDDLRNEVKRLEDKSLGKWLTVGGDFRYRLDSLRGETRAFTDVNATFQNAQQKLQGDFFANPSTAAGSSSFFGAAEAGAMSTAGALSALAQFSQAMGGVKTIEQARAFLSQPQNQGLVQGLGGFAVPVPSYTPRNSSIHTVSAGIDANAKVMRDVSFTGRLLMEKTFGGQDASAITNAGAAPFFADRVGVFDGTLGHVQSNSYAAVDRAYGTWSNIADRDMWFSVGRRPTTGGASSHLRANNPSPGTGGVPSLLIDYAFDGMTLGYAPDIDGLPGAFAKLCYGRGFESGFRNTPGNAISDTDMLGLSVVPIDTDQLRVWLQWNRGMNIFDAPAMSNTYFGNTSPKTNLGDIDWYGAGVMKMFKGVGPGNLNVFADAGVSVTHPNQNVSSQFGFQGLLTGAFFQPEAPSRKTGTAVAVGLRYDLPSRTRLGFEFNHGSKNWITFAPAAEDMWTSKAGVRGNVYEAYVIQEVGNTPIASPKGKAFFKLGARYYDFNYTGSNNWVGAPVKISDVQGQMMTLTPLSKAYDLYATFEVKF
ncbi:MAG: DUF3373 domain-containing protein [Ramlibacter sp.]|nr:DUF3373 domain-containing protein [Ramlibacter sp.]